MFRSRWLRNWLEVSRSRKNRRRLAVRSRKTIRLMLESLEERLTPSGGIPTVTQTAGSYNALTADVALDTAANTNYVIQITNDFTFNPGDQMSISKLGSGSTLTIEGQNGTNYALTGNGNRLFTVGSGQNVTFKDLALTGGIVDGSSTGIAAGGAIYDGGGAVTLSNVAVENNKVTQGVAEGGGIYAGTGSTLTIQGGSTIRSNSAVNGPLSAPPYHFGSLDYGGGIYVYGASTVTISDSSISNNTAHGGQGYNATVAGQSGGEGGQARGGGLFVGGVNWNVTLRGDTLLGNTAISGNGGNGAAGTNATTVNSTGGNGGDGGFGTEADGGGAYFEVYDSFGDLGTGTLTILNDAENPSLIVNNSAQSGSSGNGGAGGTSTGTAANSNGGQGGTTDAGGAIGGGISFFTFPGTTLNVAIANTTIYGNKAIAGNGGTGGAAGTGGSGKAGTPGTNALGAFAYSGGIGVSGGNVFTIVNSTIANNTATGGMGNGGQIGGTGGGIVVGDDGGTVILDNNTITQNTVSGSGTSGCGIAVLGGNPTLLNNVIQGNHSVGSSTPDLFVGMVTVTAPLSNASNNFIGSMSANAVSMTTNIVGNTQVQLGNVVGVDANGNPTGGPIYYPLLSGVVSIGAGTTSVLNTIAGVEGTTSANATDEIGNPRSSSGSIDLGAVQAASSSSSSAPVITGNPTSQTVAAGSSVSFTASANDATSVQWQVRTNGSIAFINIPSATSTTLTLTAGNAGAANSDEYQAVFTNSIGSTITSAATLTVNPVPPPPPPSLPSLPPPPPAPSVLNVPPLLALFDSWLGGTETVNANGTETITDSWFGIPLIVSTFDSSGDLMSVTLFGFNITFLFG